MTYCQICRHLVDEPPGHDPNCPVFTGHTVAGVSAEYIPGQGPVPFAGLPESQQPYGGTPGKGFSYAVSGDQRILTALVSILTEVARIRELLEKRLPPKP
jgi:hypothetical protein